jgi:hypothetical protein
MRAASTSSLLPFPVMSLAFSSAAATRGSNLKVIFVLPLAGRPGLRRSETSFSVMARQKYAGSYGYCKDLRLHINLKLHFDQPIFTSLTMGGTLKIKASELPNEISIELRHHTETRVQYRKGQIFADPRRCPLA